MLIESLSVPILSCCCSYFLVHRFPISVTSYCCSWKVSAFQRIFHLSGDLLFLFSERFSSFCHKLFKFLLPSTWFFTAFCKLFQFFDVSYLLRPLSCFRGSDFPFPVTCYCSTLKISTLKDLNCFPSNDLMLLSRVIPFLTS